MPAGMPPEQRHEKCGTPALNVPHASRPTASTILPPVRLVRHSSTTCSKTRLHRPWPARHGWSGTVRWWTGGRKTTWLSTPHPLYGCWFGRTPRCSIRTKRSFLLRLPHDRLPKIVSAQWANLTPHPLLPWTPSWTRIGVPPGLALTKFSHLTRRPGLGPPLSYYRNRHFPCRHLRRRRSPHSRNHPQTRWWPWSIPWCHRSSPSSKLSVLTCRAPCRLWWRKQWRHVYLRYLTSSSDVILFRCLFLLCVDIDYMLPLLVLYSSMLPLSLLYSSGHATLLVVFIHYFLPPSQTTEPPAPVLPLAPSPSGPPSQLVPPDEPQPGPSGLHRPAILVSAHIVHIVGSFPSSFSLFISLDQLSFYYIYMCRCWSLSLLFLLLGFSDMFQFFPFHVP